MTTYTIYNIAVSEGGWFGILLPGPWNVPGSYTYSAYTIDFYNGATASGGFDYRPVLRESPGGPDLGSNEEAYSAAFFEVYNDIQDDAGEEFRIEFTVVGTTNTGQFVDHVFRWVVTIDPDEPPLTFVGGPGDDVYAIQGGNNALDGGGGINTLDFTKAPGAINVDFITGIIAQDGYGGREIFENFQNAIGGGFADTIVGDALDNLLQGAGGDDFLNGGGGADTMIGGAGGDIYYINHAGDVVTETDVAGTDVVRTSITYELGPYVENLTIVGAGARNGTGNALNNILTGNDAANKLRGLAGNDTLNGGAGNDTLEGGAGIDFLRGEGGDDTYDVDHADDFVRELPGGGNDTVRSSVTRALDPNVENLILTGTAARNGSGNSQDNQITGNIAANILSGRLGNDTINGGAGDDKINGGDGLDFLTGGPGLDSFVFDVAPSATNVDTITDFNVADDTIQLDNAIFTQLGAAGALNPGMLRIGSSAADANDFLIYNAATGALYYDANANASGGAVRIATLSAGLALTAADFLVI